MLDLTKLRPITKVPLDAFGAPGKFVYVRSLSRAEITAATEGKEPWEQTQNLLAAAVCDENGEPGMQPAQVDDIPVALVEHLVDKATHFGEEAAKKK